MRKSLVAAGGASVCSLLAAMSFTATPVGAAAPPSPYTVGQMANLKQGLQIAKKGLALTERSANPYLAYQQTLKRSDFATWNARLSQTAIARAASAQLKAAKASANAAASADGVSTTGISYAEQEPSTTYGSNDTRQNAEYIPGFGTSAGKSNRIDIRGAMPDLTPRTSTWFAAKAEDNGSIPLATPVGLVGTGMRYTTSMLGNGPHGPWTGDGTNDFDFYSVDVPAGVALVADTTGSDVDTVLVVFNENGDWVTVSDDWAPGEESRIALTSDQGGRYIICVAGYSEMGAFPNDPTDSGSGNGGAATGRYRLNVGAVPLDRDMYSVDLRAGDVLGAVLNGDANGLRIYRPDGRAMVAGRGVDASGLYPPSSPLPGAGTTTVAYVAERAGRYTVEVMLDQGSYTASLEVYRPGAESDNAVQTIYLDFNGGRVNTGVWGGHVSELSPFRTFLPAWGLAKADEAAVIDAITAQVRENLSSDLIAKGQNPAVNVRVTNSKDEPGLWGQPNVSRVTVAGTIDQSWISTIGIAQFIDVGNFAHEDEALVLLDVLSQAPNVPRIGRHDASLNAYLTAASDRKKFVSQAVGNVISHEVGHLIGNYHTDAFSPVSNIIDSGGANFGNMFGVGPDNIGGTADDKDVDFQTDIYSKWEPFSIGDGWENTLNVSAWAY